MPPPVPGGRRRTLLLAAIAVVLPAAMYFGLGRVTPAGSPPELRGASLPTIEPSAWALPAATLGPPGDYRPMVTNVKIVDLDKDGLPDVLACDSRRNRVIWYRQAPRGKWEERVLGDRDLLAPCHATVIDMDGDGDLDIAVAVLG